MSNMSAFQAKKQFGQNFLHDSGVISDIIQAIHAQDSEHLIEIGPGQGAITEAILASGAKLDVIEIDNDLISLLNNKFSTNENFNLFHQDVLTFDFDI